MSSTIEGITLTFPRSTVGDVTSMSAALIDRMHALLERNADGALSDIEREQLEGLVEMAQFGHILSMALQSRTNP